MKREIKFRAWDSANSRMVFNDFYIDQKTGNCFYTMPEQFEYNQPINLYDCGEEEPILMQFTGLHDKNGKEIYEGDIVQRGIIVFANGKFQGNYYESGGGLAETWEDDLCQERDIEVLGNIYEHPNLLK